MGLAQFSQRIWNGFLWRARPFFRAVGAIILPARESEPYDFDRAKEYWHSVPRAQGANPFQTSGLANLPDEEVLREFDAELAIARAKPERKLGFDRAIESIEGIENPQVLDYGSGIGFYGLSILISNPQAIVTFADINAENLNAVKRIAHAKTFLGRSAFALVEDPEAASLQFSEPFDLILSMGVLHHTPHAPQIVRNLSRFLKAGGIFEVMLYNYHYLKLMENEEGRRLSYSSFGAKTDPRVESLSNPYSEPYDDVKAQRLFEGYELLSADCPDPCYNTYRFRKGKRQDAKNAK